MNFKSHLNIVQERHRGLFGECVCVDGCVCMYVHLCVMEACEQNFTKAVRAVIVEHVRQ